MSQRFAAIAVLYRCVHMRAVRRTGSDLLVSYRYQNSLTVLGNGLLYKAGSESFGELDWGLLCL